MNGTRGLAMTRLLVLLAAAAGPAAARADVKVAEDAWKEGGRFSRLEYGISERLERAWLVLHFTSRGPCRGSDGECELDDAVRVRVPGLTYDPATREVQFREDGASLAVCANVVRHRFLFSWDTVEATGQCEDRIVAVHAFVDDGFAGREADREEIHFGPRR